MAIRLETVNVSTIETKILNNLDYFVTDSKEAEQTLAYIAGVHDMANAVRQEIVELGGK